MVRPPAHWPRKPSRERLVRPAVVTSVASEHLSPAWRFGRRGIEWPHATPFIGRTTRSRTERCKFGELPDSMHVRGRVAWYVYSGANRDMADNGWDAFMRKVQSSGLKPRGAP